MEPSIDNLLERVSSALHELPGAVELYLFGSRADPKLKDAYSDLDLQVVSQSYDLSRPAWPWILERAGEMELAYPIVEKVAESAFLISFRGESPYHKVDIGLSQEDTQSFLSGVVKKKRLWRQSPRLEPLANISSSAYIPQPGSAEHFLVGELMSSIRYIKSRKRGQHLTCWRFLSAKFNALLRCMAWEPEDPAGFPQTALNTWDFTALDCKLAEPKRLALLAEIDCRSPHEMDAAMVDLTAWIAARNCPLYQIDGSRLAQITRFYLGFIAEELTGSQASRIN